jgi:hypothetical protein
MPTPATKTRSRKKKEEVPVPAPRPAPVEDDEEELTFDDEEEAPIEIEEDGSPDAGSLHNDREDYRGYVILTVSNHHSVRASSFKGVKMHGITNATATMLGRDGAIRLTVQGGHFDAVEAMKRLIDRKLMAEEDAILAAHNPPPPVAQPRTWESRDAPTITLTENRQDIKATYSAGNLGGKKGTFAGTFKHRGTEYVCLGVGYKPGCRDGYDAYCYELVDSSDYPGALTWEENYKLRVSEGGSIYEGVKTLYRGRWLVMTRPTNFVVPPTAEEDGPEATEEELLTPYEPDDLPF